MKFILTAGYDVHFSTQFEIDADDLDDAKRIAQVAVDRWNGETVRETVPDLSDMDFVSGEDPLNMGIYSIYDGDNKHDVDIK